MPARSPAQMTIWKAFAAVLLGLPAIELGYVHMRLWNGAKRHLP